MAGLDPPLQTLTASSSTASSKASRSSTSTTVSYPATTNTTHRQWARMPTLTFLATATLYTTTALLTYLSLIPTATNASTVVTSPAPVPLSFTNRKDSASSSSSSSFIHTMVPPPVDFSLLGQMAVLGDFDALTPVVTTGQQNNFESNTFSILELAKVSSSSSTARGTGAGDDGKILSVPVLLASFEIDPPVFSASGTLVSRGVGITATCVLDDAPHQIYIAGNFRQIPTSASILNNSTTTNSSIPVNTIPSSGLNYVGMYDSSLKRFLPMDNGLDGPVQELLCDSVSQQVYVVGQFTGPLKLESLSEVGSSNSSGYQTLSSFGGGVAVWKRTPDSTIEINHSVSSSQAGKTTVTTTGASGSWVALPFKGVDGIVTSVTKAQDGTFYFGGQFDTTTDGEAYSAPDTQPVNLDISKVMTGNGRDAEQDRNIICQPSTAARGNWIMQDNIPGYWRVLFPYYITPTLFRLWNVDTTQGPEFANRGTKTFSIMALPSNQFLNLSYIDPITHLQQHCTICTLESRSVAASVHQGYQDFLVVTPTLLNAAQVDIISWDGQGGGLGGIEIYQSEIFVRSVDEFNFASKCAENYAAAAASIASGTNHKDSKDMTAYSSFLGADWVVTKMEDGWQTVQAANISSTDPVSRQQAYVDMSPYLQESGLYDVFLYTPACSEGSSSGAAAGSSPSNACAHRGFIDVSMYFGSPDNVITLTLSQTNQADKYDKIYSGMISHSTPEFRPHVVVGPSISKTGTNSGGATQTVIVDSIQFVKQATLNNTNSLIFYRPGISAIASDTKKKEGTAQGLDYSTWGNLPTQIPSGSLINAMISYFGPFGSPSASATSTLFIAGALQGTTYSNIVAWDGSNYQGLGGASGSSSGLDGMVSDMALYQSSLYVVGSFNSAFAISITAAVPNFGGLAVYDIVSQTWTPFGNAAQTFQPNAQFRSIQLSTSASGQFQFVIEGQFLWMGENRIESMAIWDLDNQKWVRDQNASQEAGGGFPFGYVRGEISYFNRVLGSNADNGSGGSSGSSSPVLLIAGMIDSLDTYRTSSPENTAWLTASGVLKTTNLFPSISTSALSLANDDISGITTASTAPSTLLKTNAGIMYYNPTAEAWVTLIAGVLADGSIGAGYFNSPTASNPTLSFKQLSLASGASPPSPIMGEVLALGLHKDEASGFTAKGSGNDLLLLGGAFKSSSKIASLLIYDLTADQPFASTPALRGGAQSQGPVVNVIKPRPGDKAGTMVFAGDFSGVGDDVSCESICLWDPAQARTAIDKKKPLEGSFRNVYGDGAGSKKHLGVLKGVVNDITFEDDKNMFVAGDLVVNGVACGVASFNFDHGKWTTFGSMLDTTSKGSSTRPPGPDTLTGPVTAIAHDSLFHQFFVAGRSVTDGSAYFKKWNGNRFIRVSTEFMPTSEIHRIEILPASKDAPNRSPTSAATQPTPPSSDNDPNDSSVHDTTASPSSPPPSSPTAAAASANIMDPNDTTNILEQGYILLVSGKIVLGNPSSSYSLSASASASAAAAAVGVGGTMSTTSVRQESSSLAFFDGQTWFPFLQSSRNASSSLVTDTNSAEAAAVSQQQLVARELAYLFQRSDDFEEDYLSKRVDPLSAATPSIQGFPSSHSSIRVRDQGIFRALAIAHLPRIIAREYLSVPIVILISIAISLALIALIVLLGFFYVWLKRRLFKDEAAAPIRPRLGSSFMEDGYDGYLRRAGGPRGGLYATDSSLGASHGNAFNSSGSSTGMMIAGGSGKKSGFFKRAKSGKNGGEPDSSSALMDSLGITSALETARLYQAQRNNSIGGGGANTLVGSPTLREKPGTVGTFAGMNVQGGGGGSQNGSDGTGPMKVYRPNSTIQEATGAMVTQFVRTREQQMAATATGAEGEMGDGEEGDMPPSPDRRSKKSRFSRLSQSGAVRDSTASDLTNPTSQSRYASFLGPNPTGISSPTAVHSATTPTSPATAMTTPSDAIHSHEYLHNSNRDSTTSTSNRTSTPFGGPIIGGGAGGANVIYYARYPFRAREIGELGFGAGERILVVDQSDDIWWMGVVQDSVTGQQMHGVFPSNYVASTP